MTDKLRLGTDIRELKIGQSFTNTRSGAFHAVRYDFKPASVDVNKIATVDIGCNNQVTVNVPHLDGAGVPQTVFKGSHKPFAKECVLIFDRMTGEITLEKLSSNIQVKKTRCETAKPILPQAACSTSIASNGSNRPQTPPIGQRQSNKTRVTSGSRRPDRQITQLSSSSTAKHSPMRTSPNRASPAIKSPKRSVVEPMENAPPPSSHATSLGSLPMIGVDDFADEDDVIPLPPPAIDASANLALSLSDSDNGGAQEMSDSSSTSSSSDSESEHEESTAKPAIQANGGGGGGGQHAAKMPSMPTTLLNEDLCLSESGSEYDDDDD